LYLLLVVTQVENNNVVGFENLNLNNNRRKLASAESCEYQKLCNNFALMFFIRITVETVADQHRRVSSFTFDSHQPFCFDNWSFPKNCPKIRNFDKFRL